MNKKEQYEKARAFYENKWKEEQERYKREAADPMALCVTYDQLAEIRNLESDCIIFGPTMESDSFDNDKWISGLKRICGTDKIDELIYKGALLGRQVKLVAKS